VTRVWERTIDLAYKGLGVVKYCEIATVSGGGYVWDEDRTVANTIHEYQVGLSYIYGDASAASELERRRRAMST
jgi:hypothetical protein